MGYQAIVPGDIEVQLTLSADAIAATDVEDVAEEPNTVVAQAPEEEIVQDFSGNSLQIIAPIYLLCFCAVLLIIIFAGYAKNKGKAE